MIIEAHFVFIVISDLSCVCVQMLFSDCEPPDGSIEEVVLPLLRSSSSSSHIIPDTCLSALRSALTNRQLQLQVQTDTSVDPHDYSHRLTRVCMQELRERLQSAQSSVQQLRRQLGEAESGQQHAELRLQALQAERDEAHRERETAVRERDRLRKERDMLSRLVSRTPQTRHYCTCTQN